MQNLNFSYTYDKLYALNEGHRATTIRRRNKFSLGENVKVLANGQFLCYAKIIIIERVKIREIDDIKLLADVAPHADTREAAIALINKFYRIPLTEESEVFLYTLKRIPESQVIVKIQTKSKGDEIGR